jgi:hypothetical protein
VKTATTVGYEIFRELRRSAGAYKEPTLVVQCHAEVANILQVQERDELRHLMDRFNKSIQVKGHAEFHREQYDIYSRPMSGIEIRVASNSVEFDQNAWPGARKPGSQEAKGGGERAAAHSDRAEARERGSERPERGERPQGGGGKRGRDRNRGGRDRNERGGPKNQNASSQNPPAGREPKPSAPIGQTPRDPKPSGEQES